MQKKFLTNIFILLALNLLIKPFWILGVDRAVQNSVGNFQYGIYANLFGFSLLFVVLLDFGINNFTSTTIAKDHDAINQQFSTLFPVKIFLSIVYFFVTSLVGYMYGFRGHDLFLLAMMLLNQILAFFILYFRSNVSGLQYFRTDAILSVIDRTLMIVFCSLIIWSSLAKITIETFVFAQTVGYVFSTIICFMILKPHLSHIHFNIDKSVLKKLFIDAYPFALLALIMTFYTRLDIILIKKIFPNGDIENGIYAKANRLLEASNMLAAMVASMLLSLFAKIISQKEELQKMVKTSMSIMIAPAIMLAIFCSIYKVEIMNILYKNILDESSEVFGIVIFSFIPMCTIYIFGTLLTANGNLKILNIIVSIALLINVCLNVFLIPNYGAYGAAVAAICTHSFVALFSFIYSKKVLELNISLLTIGQYLFFAIVFSVILYFIHQEEIKILLSIVISGLAGLSLMFISGILNFRSIFQLVSSRIK
jgi:O-antigen/teichoic acid export membrane protein